MKDKKLNVVEEPVADYEKAELDQLKLALTRSYTERFFIMTRLMKMDIMLRNSTVTHQPDVKPEKK
jgi:hypothetical protein